MSLTSFSAERHADLPGIYRAALSLRAEWDQLEGAVGLWLWTQPLARRAGSISLWRDEAALRRFVTWAPHREIMGHYRDRGSLVASSREIESFVRPEQWPTAREWIEGN
jgi:hypothetical protein